MHGLQLGVLKDGKESSTPGLKTVDERRCSRFENAFESEDARRQGIEGNEADSRGATPKGRDLGYWSWSSSVSVLGEPGTLGSFS